MFNVGGPEILVVILVALVVLGPQQLPKAMRTMGSVMAEVRKISNGFQAEMRNAMDSVVEPSAPEKPKSADMAPAGPNAIEAEGSETPGPSTPEPGTAADKGTGESSADGASPGDRPPVDPADRAAG